MAFPVLLYFLQADFFAPSTDLLHTYRLILMVLVGTWLVFAACCCMQWSEIQLSSLLTLSVPGLASSVAGIPCIQFHYIATKESSFGNHRIVTALVRGQFVQQLWTGKQHNVSHSCLNMGDWRETRGSSSSLASGSAPVSWPDPSVACLPLWPLDTLCFCPRLCQPWACPLGGCWAENLRRGAPREGFQESAAMATMQHVSTTTAPADLVNQHYSFKNTLFPIVCSSILLSAAFQRLEIFGY